MGMLARLFSRETLPTAGLETRDASAFSDPALGPFSALLPGGRLYANRSTPEQAIQALAVASRCVSLISESLAATPLTVYERLGDGGRQARDNHPISRLLNDAANDSMSAFEFRDLIVRDVATGGNGFARIVRDGRGGVSELYHLPAQTVSLERLPSGRLRYRHSDPITGAQSILLADEVIHLRYASRDGLIGIGPLAWSSGAVALAVQQSELAEGQAASGFVPPTVFHTSQTFGTDQMAEIAFRRLRDQLAAGLDRLRRDSRPLLLEAGLEAKSLASPMREEQFHESRVLSLEDVARCFGVPLSVIGLGKNSSYGSLTEESRSLKQNCLRPWARRTETQLALALMSADARRQFTIEHDLSDLERGALKERLESWKVGIDAGFFTTAEVRRWEGLTSEASN